MIFSVMKASRGAVHTAMGSPHDCQLCQKSVVHLAWPSIRYFRRSTVHYWHVYQAFMVVRGIITLSFFGEWGSVPTPAVIFCLLN